MRLPGTPRYIGTPEAPEARRTVFRPRSGAIEPGDPPSRPGVGLPVLAFPSGCELSRTSTQHEEALWQTE